MGKTLAQVDLQIRELIGDYQVTSFSPAQVLEAVNWAQDLVIRQKGFKQASRLYDMTAYPTGPLPTDLLTIKRVQLVQTTLTIPYYTITVAPLAISSPFAFPPFAATLPVQFTVTITRYNGYSAPVDITFPAINDIAWDGTSAYINSPVALAANSLGLFVADVSVPLLSVYPNSLPVYTNAPDSFILGFKSTGQTWTIGTNMANGTTLIGGYGTTAAVTSNIFSLTYFFG